MAETLSLVFLVIVGILSWFFTGHIGSQILNGWIGVLEGGGDLRKFDCNRPVRTLWQLDMFGEGIFMGWLPFLGWLTFAISLIVSVVFLLVCVGREFMALLRKRFSSRYSQ